MNDTQQQDDGNVQRTKDVIDIIAVVPDDDRKKHLVTTDFAEALKDEVKKEAPLSGFPHEDNKTDDDEKEEDKEK